MESSSGSRNLLSPQSLEDRPPSNIATGRIWDPAAGAYRDQRLPLSLSKSSLSPPSWDDASKIIQSQEQGQGTSTSTSTSSSLRSVPSSTTSLSHTGLSSGRSSHGVLNGKLPLQNSSLPQRIFRNLPTSVYLCILRQLKIIHEGDSSRGCQSCYLRDLCALSLTSRAWDKVVVKWMYERIHLVGIESKEVSRRKKVKFGLRLRLLRRTLRTRIFLAQLVRELKVPSVYADGDIIPKEMIDLVASVVMACPNLETLDGLYPIYSHEYDRLTHALSTRHRLKQHMWLIGQNAAIEERSRRQLAPGLMDPMQKLVFVQYHNCWAALSTLILYSPERGGVLEKDVFINLKINHDPRRIRGLGALHRLPSLKHLCIANFDMDDFDDIALQSLPPLESLRLQELEGVTFWGLSEFARTKVAFSIRNLSLVNLDVTYISAISNLMLHLKNLKRFTIVQDTSPEMAEGEVSFHPIIASNQVEYIHWDIVVPGTANENLASAIRAGGFPRLRTLRAPSDHNGLLQALCRPRACIVLPSDWSGKELLLHGMPIGGLREARRAAQQRIEDAWATVQFKVVVEDAEEGVVHEIYDLNGFMGTVGSKINYVLDPDVPGSDWALMDFCDVVGEKEETEENIGTTNLASSSSSSHNAGAGKKSTMCQGIWNAQHPHGSKWWRHTARPTYTSINWMKFF